MRYFILPLLPFLLLSCRDDEIERELKWSCVQLNSRHPTATTECMQKLKNENSIILKHFRAVPVAEGNKIDRFALIETRIK